MRYSAGGRRVVAMAISQLCIINLARRATAPARKNGESWGPGSVDESLDKEEKSDGGELGARTGPPVEYGGTAVAKIVHDTGIEVCPLREDCT